MALQSSGYAASPQPLIHNFRLYLGRTVDIAVNLEFAEGGESVLDGIFVGLGYGITSAIELVGGYSLGRGKELSLGFQRAMGRFITDHINDPNFPEFKNIRLTDGVIENIKDYDGLPLAYVDSDEMTRRIFPGNPVTDSFNSKVSIGFVIPLDIWKTIKGGDTNE